MLPCLALDEFSRFKLSLFCLCNKHFIYRAISSPCEKSSVFLFRELKLHGKTCEEKITGNSELIRDNVLFLTLRKTLPLTQALTSVVCSHNEACVFIYTGMEQKVKKTASSGLPMSLLFKTLLQFFFLQPCFQVCEEKEIPKGAVVENRSGIKSTHLSSRGRGFVPAPAMFSQGPSTIDEGFVLQKVGTDS